jgi:2-haloacid dehalogenase
MSERTLVWDLGNVLIDWSPRYLYDKIFSDRKEQEYFLEHICNSEWHNAVDAGRPTADATEELVKKYPDWAQPIKAFYARWKEMFQGIIEGSVEILKDVKERGYGQYALTNWSAELFEKSRADFPFLGWFDGVVISGVEGITKPDSKIYLLLLERYSLRADTIIYIDDKEENVAAAGRLGMEGVLFRSPEQLRRDLSLRGVL